MASNQDLEDSDIGELEAVEAQQAEAQKAAEQEPELPAKYRGKSVAEIARMHEEAEKLIARQGQEVGEVRKLADELIKSQLKAKPEVEKPQQEVDFFENPQEAIRRAVETNPKVQQAEAYALMVQRQMAQQTVAQKHPDMMQVISDPEFQQWVGKSKVRQQLFRAADAYDADAADELLTTFKELKGSRGAPVKADKEAIGAQLKSASVDTGGTGEVGKKTYSRRKLIELRIKQPAKFASMQAEIDAAYREGRVKP